MLRHISALTLLVSATAASASVVPLGPIKEHFDITGPVVGSTLVGLQLGTGAAPLKLEDMAVGLPDGEPHVLCLSMTTRDGVYSGSQAFRIEGAQTDRVSLGLHSSLRPDELARLQQYHRADLAVSAQLRNDCDRGAQGVFVPAYWPGSQGDNVLTAYFSVSHSRLLVGLLGPHDHPLPNQSASCAAIGSGRVTGYDHVCTITFDPSTVAPQSKLVVKIIGPTGNRDTETYLVGLPHVAE